MQEIKTINRRLGQYLGVNSKKSDAEKEVYKSQKITLEKYKNILTKAKAGSELLGEGLKKKKKRVKVDQVVFYQNPDQLLQLLHENIEALKAGNNGVYNTIVGILDELLKIGKITKEAYDVYKNVKRGRGRPKGDQVQVVPYKNPTQLVQLLRENLTALKAGNNGVYNTVVGILDELLKIRVITKEAYDDIYKNNFSII